jgi:hypothetical protein
MTEKPRRPPVETTEQKDSKLEKHAAKDKVSPTQGADAPANRPKSQQQSDQGDSGKKK